MTIYKHGVLVLYYSFLCSGCVTPITIQNPGKLQKTDTYQLHESRFAGFFGLITSSKKIKPWEKCSYDWHIIEIKQNQYHILTSFITLGLLSPFTVTATCLKKPLSPFEKELKED